MHYSFWENWGELVEKRWCMASPPTPLLKKERGDRRNE
jgi:hypothetical protein